MLQEGREIWQATSVHIFEESFTILFFWLNTAGEAYLSPVEPVHGTACRPTLKLALATASFT